MIWRQKSHMVRFLPRANFDKFSIFDRCVFPVAGLVVGQQPRVCNTMKELWRQSETGKQNHWGLAEGTNLSCRSQTIHICLPRGKMTTAHISRTSLNSAAQNVCVVGLNPGATWWKTSCSLIIDNKTPCGVNYMWINGTVFGSSTVKEDWQVDK